MKHNSFSNPPSGLKPIQGELWGSPSSGPRKLRFIHEICNTLHYNISKEEKKPNQKNCHAYLDFQALKSKIQSSHNVSSVLHLFLEQAIQQRKLLMKKLAAKKPWVYVQLLGFYVGSENSVFNMIFLCPYATLWDFLDKKVFKNLAFCSNIIFSCIYLWLTLNDSEKKLQPGKIYNCWFSLQMDGKLSFSI